MAAYDPTFRLSKVFSVTVGNLALAVYGYNNSIGSINKRYFYKDHVFAITAAPSSDNITLQFVGGQFAGESEMVLTLGGTDYTVTWGGSAYTATNATASAYLQSENGNTINVTVKTGSEGRVEAATRS